MTKSVHHFLVGSFFKGAGRFLVAGGAGGMQGGRHLRYDKPTPLANLHHALLEKAGVDLDAFGDSTGPLKELFEPLGI